MLETEREKWADGGKEEGRKRGGEVGGKREDGEHILKPHGISCSVPFPSLLLPSLPPLPWDG